MIFLPIVERELRVASRRSATYWSRFQAGLVALVPALFLLAGPIQFSSLAQQGAHLFQILAFLAFFYAMLSAVRLTADCLSGEKREGTLGLLFLTDLKPYDIVLGKLAATSFTSLYGLVALLPILAIPILLGGVTLADLMRLALVLINTLFFALSLAMLISALCWREKTAVGMTILLLFAFCGGLPIVGAVVAALNGFQSLAPILSVASPGFACGMISDAAYVGGRWAFWLSVVITHGMGWLFLILTCRVLPRVWQDRPAEGRRLRWHEWCRRLLLGDTTVRKVFRRRLLVVNPIYWLASRERRTIWYPWLLLASLTAIGAWACWQVRARGVQFEPLILVSFAVNWFYKHWITNAACHAFSIDRDKGALELLLCTPLTIRDVLRGHTLALRRQFLAPVLTLVAAELVLYAFAWHTDSMDRGSDQWLLPATFFCGLVVFVADIFALVWVGWWAGVVSKNASSAISTAYVRLMILPWLLVALGLVLFFVLFDIYALGQATVALVVWTITSLCADGFFAFSARRKLLTELRAAAVERYSGGDPSALWWRRLGRRVAQWHASSRPSPARVLPL